MVWEMIGDASRGQGENLWQTGIGGVRRPVRVAGRNGAARNEFESGASGHFMNLAEPRPPLNTRSNTNLLCPQHARCQALREQQRKMRQRRGLPPFGSRGMSGPERPDDVAGSIEHRLLREE